MLFCLFKVLFAFSLPFGVCKNVEPIPKQVSCHEKFFLNKYFEHLVRYEHLGHVLFLDKPMAYASFPIKGIPSYPVNCIIKGWYVWNKYKEGLSFPNYIIVSEIHKNKFNSGVDVCEVFIINRSALHKVIIQNEHFFKKKMGEEFSPDKFIADLESSDSPCSIIKENAAVFGVMLGYGIDSSIYFEQGNRNAIDTYGNNNQMMSIAPVRFVSDPNSTEAKSLVVKCESEVTALLAIYQNRRFFETSIKQLCSGVMYPKQIGAP